MPFNVTLEFPDDLEDKLRRDSIGLGVEVREAFLLELFRRGKIGHFELSCSLGIDRFETDAWLKLHGVFQGSLTMDDLESDRQALEHLMDRHS